MTAMKNEAEMGRRRILEGIAILGLGAAATGCTVPQGPAEAETRESDSSSQYIFGYGSLIQKESREETWPKVGKAFPVSVKGITRGWYDRVDTVSWGPTYLGAFPDRASTCNGVIFQVAHGELKAFADREKGYKLIRIPPVDITMLDGRSAPPPGTFWYFGSASRRYVSQEFPIVQSYVDVCVSGCLEIEDEFPASRTAKFAQNFFTGTTDWKTPWINDRIYPWRPFVHVPQANRIDALIRDQLGEEVFRSISLPGAGT
ncbi:gamma-glutamylcyclotransferase family protein [Streptomyces sp. AcE210]|uniref:gamma-glutamylcyclotransferase family protein n=1 Tax=Streptomyces sp. AcE210 TaxID=2292703 RepID=UPI001058C3F0|nr:gamma-glutamylcyclotransferase family protein [Streptomyces sp. AcE210]